MSLDQKTEQAILEAMGPNVYRQINMVVPEFFGDKYIVTKLVPKQKHEQLKGSPIVHLEPQVVASAHPNYAVGSLINIRKVLTDLIRDGFNVSVSPIDIRKYDTHPLFLEEGPKDRLVIAEVPITDKRFGRPETFYHHSEFPIHIKIEDWVFGELASRYYTHFAFVPQGEKPRNLHYLDFKSWDLKILDS